MTTAEDIQSILQREANAILNIPPILWDKRKRLSIT